MRRKRRGRKGRTGKGQGKARRRKCERLKMSISSTEHLPSTTGACPPPPQKKILAYTAVQKYVWRHFGCMPRILCMTLPSTYRLQETVYYWWEINVSSSKEYKNHYTSSFSQKVFRLLTKIQPFMSVWSCPPKSTIMATHNPCSAPGIFHFILCKLQAL